MSKTYLCSPAPSPFNAVFHVFSQEAGSASLDLCIFYFNWRLCFRVWLSWDLRSWFKVLETPVHEDRMGKTGALLLCRNNQNEDAIVLLVKSAVCCVCFSRLQLLEIAMNSSEISKWSCLWVHYPKIRTWSGYRTDETWWPLTDETAHWLCAGLLETFHANFSSQWHVISISFL